MTSSRSPARLRTAACGLLLLLGSLASAPSRAETVVLAAAPHARDLQGLAVSFLAKDLASGTDYVLEGSDLRTRRPPFSTFKIPNLLIALETGVATSPDHWRDWDPRSRPADAFWPASWKQGQTLRSAFARSAVWYFRDLALAIGAPTYRRYLTAWSYGNVAVPDRSDDFWLGKPLAISVREQIGFLEALLTRRLRVSDASLAALDEASLSGAAQGLSLHGKTGTGPDIPDDLQGPFSGWYVGYVRRDGGAPVVFALFMKAPSFAALKDFRRAFALRLLSSARLVPAGTFADQ